MWMSEPLVPPMEGGADTGESKLGLSSGRRRKPIETVFNIPAKKSF